jgi:hypothetical protein
MAHEHIDGPTTFDLKSSELKGAGKTITVDNKFSVGELKITQNEDGSVRFKFSGR